jgi:hypothetical protein
MNGLSNVRLALVVLIAAVTVQAARGQCPPSVRRIAIGALSLAYVGNAAYGGYLAMRDTLEEAPFGVRMHRPVADDFYTGFGTGLSPGVPMLVAQVGVSAMLLGSSRAAQRGANVLAVFGALYTIGQLAEPITYRTLRHPSAAPERARVILANVLIPAALTAVAARTCG